MQQLLVNKPAGTEASGHGDPDPSGQEGGGAHLLEQTTSGKGEGQTLLAAGRAACHK